jgi:putative transposase
MSPIRPNVIWAMDFHFDTTADGRTMKMLNVIDEFTREALAIDVARAIDADGVVDVLERLVLERGAPHYVRLTTVPNSWRTPCTTGADSTVLGHSSSIPTTTPTGPTLPTENSPQPSSLYSGPRPTNPKPHSDWTTKRVPLTGPRATASPDDSDSRSGIFWAARNYARVRVATGGSVITPRKKMSAYISAMSAGATGPSGSSQ